MYVIAVYDISTMETAGQRRLARIMKKMRQYLHHTQKSVFEGELSIAKLMALQKEAKRLSMKKQIMLFFSESIIRKMSKESASASN